MKLYELLKKYTNEEIIEELKKHYNDIVDEAYESALTELRLITPSKKEQDIKINVEMVTKNFGELLDEPFLSCDGLGPDPDNENEIVRWGIEFDDWDEWLAKEINEDNFKELSEITILAGVIWELTFCGYDQKEIQSKAQQIFENAKYAKEHPEELIEITPAWLNKILEDKNIEVE